MNKKTVFLLQATKEQNEELAKMFENSKDYEVCGMAVDGISAIFMIEDKKPDVLITELVIAGYDGLSVIAKVKALNLNTKIVVLSSLISEEIISKCSASGADYYLAKPVNFDLLIERLDSFGESSPLTAKEVSESIIRFQRIEYTSMLPLPHPKRYQGH